MKLFDRQKYNPFTVPVPGTDSAAITAEREAVLAEQTALENQLPQKTKTKAMPIIGRRHYHNFTASITKTAVGVLKSTLV